MLAFYNIDMKKIVEPGEFEVMIGGNSIDVLTKSFEITE
jgi:beta-glucosidase